MKYTFFGKSDPIVYMESENVLITDAQSALDLLVTMKYEKGCSGIILDKKAICEEFFMLSSGIAGEVLQKFVNYHTKLLLSVTFLSIQASLYKILYSSATRAMTFSL
ncbi:DUF4180 domain-containing protein [Tepidanaerobacter sp. GT38]|nr:DUF4180 domain-containing protein [Tepidanaerobacter sp. GT38]MCG1013243.1 DUF4180 domain-containing protein [Tepidanaerobacter sp. GT38]